LIGRSLIGAKVSRYCINQHFAHFRLKPTNGVAKGRRRRPRRDGPSRHVRSEEAGGTERRQRRAVELAVVAVSSRNLT
jgi:hypothetical protein